MSVGAIVNGHTIWRAIWTATLARVGFTTVSALALAGWVRAGEASQHQDRGALVLYGALALLAGAAALAGVAPGLYAMASK